MSWANGSPVRLRGSMSIVGIVIGRDPKSCMAEVRNREGEVLSVHEDNLVIAFDAAQELANSIGATMIDPKELSALIDLLTTCNPTDGPLKSALDRLNAVRGKIQEQIQNVFERLGGQVVVHGCFQLPGSRQVLRLRWAGSHLQVVDNTTIRSGDVVMDHEFHFGTITHQDITSIATKLLVYLKGS